MGLFSCHTNYRTSVASQTISTKMIQRIELKRSRQSPLWQTATSADMFTASRSGQVCVLRASISPPAHAFHIVGMKVRGPRSERFRNIWPLFVFINFCVANLIFSARLSILRGIENFSQKILFFCTNMDLTTMPRATSSDIAFSGFLDRFFQSRLNLYATSSGSKPTLLKFFRSTLVLLQGSS